MIPVEPRLRDYLVEVAKVFGFTFAVFGWVWFIVMVSLKYSGATIYATTRQSVIQRIDPAWDEAILGAFGEKGSGFSVKFQGLQPDPEKDET